jgi:hypothetical protein
MLNGSVSVVLSYLKQPLLTQDAANADLRIIETQLAALLANCLPVLDIRHAKIFARRRNANRDKLDAWLRAAKLRDMQVSAPELTTKPHSH